jgi:hypothetical protein
MDLGLALANTGLRGHPQGRRETSELVRTLGEAGYLAPDRIRGPVKMKAQPLSMALQRTRRPRVRSGRMLDSR